MFIAAVRTPLILHGLSCRLFTGLRREALEVIPEILLMKLENSIFIRYHHWKTPVRLQNRGTQSLKNFFRGRYLRKLREEFFCVDFTMKFVSTAS